MSAPAPKSTTTSTPVPTFDFTKRKRWADLLIHELSDAIVFVLSANAKIWFCGRAVTEILGWSDVELIDRFFIELVNPEDHRAFHVAFDQSLRTRQEMNSYVRFKTRPTTAAHNVPQSEVLFEVKGYPYFIEHELAARCFFAVAKPYPSRNTAMLNTFLELKAENECLQTRVAELRLRDPSPSALIPGSSTSPACSASVSAPSVTLRSSDVPNMLYSQHLPHPSYDNFSSSLSQTQGSYDSPSRRTYNGQYTTASSTLPPDDDFGDDTSRRKKMRKSNTTEQYVCVTCGRTDSPEWRKGPQGPKTLCNACGLRWAKEVRSKDNAAAGASTTAVEA